MVALPLDQFLALPLKTDGTPVEPDFLEQLRKPAHHRRLGRLRDSEFRQYPTKHNSKPLRSYPERLSCL